MSVYLIADVKVTDDSWIPDYASYGQARRDGSVSRFNIIDDTDVAGAIPYLGKG